MANHKSALKRIKSNEAKRLRNKYQLKSTRTLVKKVKAAATKVDAEALFKLASSALDKLARKNVIHKNNAANHKSKLAKLVNKIAA